MKSRRPSRAVTRCMLAMLVALAACGSDSTGPVVSSVTVTAAGPNVIVGHTTQLIATVRDGAGNVMQGQQVTWSSDAGGIASVNGSGLVTGVAIGTARITATVSGHSGNVEVTVVPPPVASITISPPDPAVDVNGTVQLTATTLDATGGELPGRTVTWSSANNAIATVSGAGLALGVSPGAVLITATSEGVSASVSLMVMAPPGSLFITDIAPAQLVEGASATITGDGFSTAAGGNTVTIDGSVATVTAVSATSLTIIVPAGDCMPARSNAVIRVAVGGQTAERTHAVRPAQFTDLPLGQLTLLSDPTGFCLQFDESATGTSYLIGVQSVSPTATSRTPARLRSRTAGAAAGGVLTTSVVRAGGGSIDPLAMAGASRRARHQEAELELRRHDHALGSALLAQGGAGGSAALRMATAAAVPGTVNPGDTVSVRVPSTCTESVTIQAVVRHRGTRGIWIEDVGNPDGGFSTADYQALSGMLDNQIWSSNTTYFGEPTDIDFNGRIVIVVTKAVNAREGLLGFVSIADFFPDDCPAANGGEYYYGRAPDPTGEAGAAYSLADALQDAPSLISHEFAHIIQIGRRLDSGANTLATIWELEGQATFAEEVAGHAFTGYSIAQNYGFSVAWNEAGTPPIAWYRTPFIDLALYYGYESPESKVANAPEQCGWLGRPSDNDRLGPCLGNRRLYGVSWSFLRWLSDQYGPAYPGGEAALHRALVVDPRSGFQTISGVIGAPIDQLLAGWAASLYLDDRVAGMESRLRFTSWNFTGIFDGLVSTARLTPRTRSFSTFTDDITVIAGSTAYFTVSGTTRPATAMWVRTQTDGPLPASMRVWIVRTQ